MTDKLDASDQIVNSKSDLANMVRILTMQRDKLVEEVERLKQQRTTIEATAEAREFDNSTLRAENERLREALQNALEYGVTSRNIASLQAALQSKQGE